MFFSVKLMIYLLKCLHHLIDKSLTEDDLFKLELDAFMRLIETKETQDRIKHTLATGKPLIN